MSRIEQSIKIRADLDTSAVKRGTADINKLQNAVTGVLNTQKEGGAISKKDVAGILSGAEGLQATQGSKNYDRQLDVIRKINREAKFMAMDFDKNAGIGSNKHLKNMTESLDKLRKMNRIDTQSVDRRRGVRAGDMGLLAYGGKLVSGANERDIVGTAGNISNVTGIGLQQAGRSVGGGGGAFLLGAGKIGLGLALGAAIFKGVDRLFSGDFEEIAERGYNLERAQGQQIPTKTANYIKTIAKNRLVDRGNLFTALDSARDIGGAVNVAGSGYDVSGLLESGVVSGNAGSLIGLSQRYGRNLGERNRRFGTNAFRRLAVESDHGARMNVFANAVSSLTQSIENMGDIVDPMKVAKSLSQLSEYGERFVGQGGARTAGKINQAILGAQELQSAGSQMLFRIASRRTGGDIDKTMQMLSEGISNPELLQSAIDDTKIRHSSKFGQIRSLQTMFGLTYQEASGLLDKRKMPETDKRKTVDVTEDLEGFAFTAHRAGKVHRMISTEGMMVDTITAKVIKGFSSGDLRDTQLEGYKGYQRDEVRMELIKAVKDKSIDIDNETREMIAGEIYGKITTRRRRPDYKELIDNKGELVEALNNMGAKVEKFGDDIKVILMVDGKELELDYNRVESTNE